MSIQASSLSNQTTRELFQNQIEINENKIQRNKNRIQELTQENNPEYSTSTKVMHLLLGLMNIGLGYCAFQQNAAATAMGLLCGGILINTGGYDKNLSEKAARNTIIRNSINSVIWGAAAMVQDARHPLLSPVGSFAVGVSAVVSIYTLATQTLSINAQKDQPNTL